MRRLILNFLFVSLAFFVQVDTAQGMTGSRLKSRDESPSEIAALHYKRGLKAAGKAARYQQQAASADNGKKKSSLLSKAEKQYRKAISLYKRALSVNPSLSRVHTDLGHALVETGHFEEALTALDHAISNNRHDTDAITYRSEAMMKLDQSSGGSE